MLALTDREKEVLAHLLSTDFPGRDELRKQVELAQVTVREPGWIEFVVDDRAPNAAVENYRVVEAEVSEETPPVEVALYARNGRLKILEVVTYGEPYPLEPPSAASLDPPVVTGS